MNGSRNRTDVCKVDVHITSTRLLVFPLRILVEPSQRVLPPQRAPLHLPQVLHRTMSVCVRYKKLLQLLLETDIDKLRMLAL